MRANLCESASKRSEAFYTEYPPQCSVDPRSCPITHCLCTSKVTPEEMLTLEFNGETDTWLATNVGNYAASQGSGTSICDFQKKDDASSIWLYPTPAPSECSGTSFWSAKTLKPGATVHDPPRETSLSTTHERETSTHEHESSTHKHGTSTNEGGTSRTSRNAPETRPWAIRYATEVLCCLMMDLIDLFSDTSICFKDGKSTSTVGPGKTCGTITAPNNCATDDSLYSSASSPLLAYKTDMPIGK